MYTHEKISQEEEPKKTVPQNQRVETPNLTGIPDSMKIQFENASGFSFDDVRVHYNSDKPSQLQALAYTKGHQVYIGPGQERHLKHELGHVIQQKQGIVKPTYYQNNIGINDDAALEKQADSRGDMPMGGNRPTTPVVQMIREDVQNYFSRMSKAGNSRLNLYTHVMGDGLGDIGQMSFLYKKILDNQKKLKLGSIVPMATFSGSQLKDDKKIEKRKQQITNLAPPDTKMIHVETSESKKRKKLTDKVPTCEYNDSDWEIQYPYPDIDSPPETDKVLKISEMGTDKKFMISEKSGEMTGGIGYGIPTLVTNKKLDDLIEELLDPLRIYSLEQFKLHLPNAFLFNVKSYEGHTLAEQRIKNIKSITKKFGVSLALVLGIKDGYEQDEGLNVVYAKGLPNDELRALMKCITNGMIFSGGEGFYAESLGLDHADTASVLAGAYCFQYMEVAHALLPRGEVKKINMATDAGKRDAATYRILKYEDMFYYYDMKCYMSLETARVTSTEPNSPPFMDKCVECSTGLSALWLPLSINAGIPGDVPPPIFQNLSDIKDIFLEEKKRLREGNWFSLIDMGIIGPDDSK